MSELKVADKEIVVPGQELARGLDYLPAGAAFREGDNIIASQIGLISINGKVIKLIPLSGRYIPRVNDLVIGTITDVSFNNWFVDIGYAYKALLSIRDIPEYVDRNADLSRYYDFDDLISAKISKVTRAKTVDLTMKSHGLMKLTGGRLITVSPNKVPRIIGKQGSMIEVVKNLTDCWIIVGQNGLVWIKGKDAKKEILAVNAIMKIERESHTDGLTDKIKAFLEDELKK